MKWEKDKDVPLLPCRSVRLGALFTAPYLNQEKSSLELTVSFFEQIANSLKNAVSSIALPSPQACSSLNADGSEGAQVFGDSAFGLVQKPGEGLGSRARVLRISSQAGLDLNEESRSLPMGRCWRLCSKPKTWTLLYRYILSEKESYWGLPIPIPLPPGCVSILVSERRSCWEWGLWRIGLDQTLSLEQFSRRRRSVSDLTVEIEGLLLPFLCRLQIGALVLGPNNPNSLTLPLEFRLFCLGSKSFSSVCPFPELRHKGGALGASSDVFGVFGR